MGSRLLTYRALASFERDTSGCCCAHSRLGTRSLNVDCPRDVSANDDHEQTRTLWLGTCIAGAQAQGGTGDTRGKKPPSACAPCTYPVCALLGFSRLRNKFRPRPPPTLTDPTAQPVYNAAGVRIRSRPRIAIHGHGTQAWAREGMCLSNESAPRRRPHPWCKDEDGCLATSEVDVFNHPRAGHRADGTHAAGVAAQCVS